MLLLLKSAKTRRLHVYYLYCNQGSAVLIRMDMAFPRLQRNLRIIGKQLSEIK